MTPMKYKMPYKKCRDSGKPGHTTSESRFCGIKGHFSNSSYRSSTRYKSIHASVCLKVYAPRNKWIIDSGCSRHMTGYKSIFLSLKAKDGGLVTLVDSNTIRITGKGTIGNDRCMLYCTKANEFALVPKRKGNISVLDFDEQHEEICLASIQEQQTLWHMRLGHVHMDLLRKISSRDLVRGLPKLKYKKVEHCTASRLGKQVKTSFIAKNRVSTTDPL
ncbi:uncharacterized protein LOC141664899 [Apium graveolens]|uniref:uncharacterized protein LOC141664899 n=1 Tax=Apium graveolens TaxID=4045 RepID=UPI003D7BF25D